MIWDSYPFPGWVVENKNQNKCIYVIVIFYKIFNMCMFFQEH